MAKKKTKKNPPPKKKDTSELKGILALAAALICLLSLISFSLHGAIAQNWVGATGNAIGEGLTTVFGLSSYLLIPFAAWAGLRLIFKKPLNHMLLKTSWVFMGIVSTSLLLSVLEVSYPNIYSFLHVILYQASWTTELTRYHLGGTPFFYLYYDMPYHNLHYLLNTIGVTILFSFVLAASVLYLAHLNIFSWLHILAKWLLSLRFPSWVKWPRFSWTRTQPEPVSAVPETVSLKPSNEPVSDFLRYVKLRLGGASQALQAQPYQAEVLEIKPETNLKMRPSLSRKGNAAEEPLPCTPVELPQEGKDEDPEKEPKRRQRREQALTAQRIHNGDFTEYKLPPASLLTNAKKIDHALLKKDLKHKAEVLEETLLSFGIEAKVGQINCGPTITSFEVHPAIGVKVQKIKTLGNDIALNMEAKSIRIIAPIPGKAAVGIEVPNAQPEEVGFKEMFTAYLQGERKFRIPILLGKTVHGDYVMSDLTKMPHCIIAGATGSGKSVCINTLVMSILMSAKPDEIKLVMVDPKKVELTPYARLPHMLAPVITEPQGACAALNWLVKEMEKRYEILRQTGARNIEVFNNRKIDKEFEEALNADIPERLPYIVGIIDELADLMMVSSSDIETPIARIAQMARAVGIHLILATQRPSREVITGLIKANFPTRIAFKVSSRINSQIILDDVGAESLLGNGDMLFLPPGSSHLVRAQGAFIRDEDINAVVKAICEQAPPRYVIDSFDTIGQIDALEAADIDEPGDELYTQALDVVISTGNASTTFLQRKLKIGYARAASLIDMLEQRGIVGPAEGSKPRKVLAGKGAAKEENQTS